MAEVQALIGPEPLHRCYRVLLVDDDRGDLLLYRASLNACDQATFESSEALSGQEAFEMVARDQYDVVLLDYNLPDGKGTDMISQFRESANDPDLAIIVLTGFSEASIVIEAMHQQASDYLPKKNISPHSLHRAIRNAVTKSDFDRKERDHLEQITAMNAELQQKNREIEAFYQSISHELKTPLTAIREYTSLVVDGIAGEITDDTREFLTTSLECTDRLTRLVNDLFDTVRIETGKLTLQRRSADLVMVVEQTLALLNSERRDKGIEWHVETTIAEPEFIFDPDRITQVLTNLLTNALKFTPAEGRIDVHIEQLPERRYAKVSVIDTGRGIADGDLRSVFDRLFQTSIGDSINHSGMGIGLHLCKAIIEGHDGEIWVESQLGEGSNFQFTLPLDAHGD